MFYVEWLVLHFSLRILPDWIGFYLKDKNSFWNFTVVELIQENILCFTESYTALLEAVKHKKLGWIWVTKTFEHKEKKRNNKLCNGFIIIDLCK